MKKAFKILILSLSFLVASPPAFSFEDVHQEKFAALKKRTKKPKVKRKKKRRKKKKRSRTMKKHLRFYAGALGGVSFHVYDIYKIKEQSVAPSVIAINYNPYLGLYLFDLWRLEAHFSHRLPGLGTEERSSSDESVGNYEVSFSSMSITLDNLIEFNLPKTPVHLYAGVGAGLGFNTLTQWAETWTGDPSSGAIIMGATTTNFNLKGSLGVAFNIGQHFLIDLRGDIYLLGSLQSMGEISSGTGDNAHINLPLTGSFMPIEAKLGVRGVL